MGSGFFSLKQTFGVFSHKTQKLAFLLSDGMGVSFHAVFCCVTKTMGYAHGSKKAEAGE